MSADVKPFPAPAAPASFAATSSTSPYAACLDAHEAYIAAARSLYTPQVVWCAPNRSIEWRGRELVIRQLLREGGGMHEPEFTLIRRNQSDQQIIDEFAVRFVYSGSGIDNAPIAAGDFVELKRVRVLAMSDGRCSRETCIESWSVLLPGDGTP